MTVFARRVLVLLCVLGIHALGGPAATRAADHGDDCAVAKLRASKSYNACLVKQEIRSIKKDEPTDPTKCNSVLDRKWTKAEDLAVRKGGICYDNSSAEQADVQGELTRSVGVVSDILTEIPGVSGTCGFSAPSCNGTCPGGQACVPQKQCGSGVGNCSTDSDCTPFGCMNVGCGCAPTDEMKTVFVTSSQYEGNLGGLGGADAICNAHAQEASLSGTYAAWLSDTKTSAGGRLAHAPVPYVRTDNVVVANNWADLTDGQLLNPIDRNEFGVIEILQTVWTCTDRAGNSICKGGPGTGSNPLNLRGTACEDWTTSLYDSFNDPNPGGSRGGPNSTNEVWTEADLVPCNFPLVLYCIQQ